MKEIYLTQGKVALVDDCDYEKINSQKWCAAENRGNFYAKCKLNGKGVSMHRIILNIADPEIFVDHRDGNGLNNQRSNLRLTGRSGNGANRKPSSKKESQFLGIFRDRKKWVASLGKNGQSFTVRCETEIDAAKAYNALAIEHHGEFARLNKIP
jgi:hypothetical protein